MAQATCKARVLSTYVSYLGLFALINKEYCLFAIMYAWVLSTAVAGLSRGPVHKAGDAPSGRRGVQLRAQGLGEARRRTHEAPLLHQRGELRAREGHHHLVARGRRAGEGLRADPAVRHPRVGLVEQRVGRLRHQHRSLPAPQALQVDPALAAGAAAGRHELPLRPLIHIGVYIYIYIYIICVYIYIYICIERES